MVLIIIGLPFLLFSLLIFIEFFTVPDVSVLADRNPNSTALIEARNKEYRARGVSPRRSQVWTPFGSISFYLKGAVLVAEDISFYEHGGYDLSEIKQALKINLKKKRIVRGASTITQQLAKNLYLSTSKNPLRKIKEFFIALELEKRLTKQRIFELYLNTIEWGTGVYGAEAASQAWFFKSARNLTIDEAARLAIIIPNPRVMTPRDTSRKFEQKRRLVLRRMWRYGFIDSDQLVAALISEKAI